jgi:hypothetical protein
MPSICSRHIDFPRFRLAVFEGIRKRRLKSCLFHHVVIWMFAETSYRPKINSRTQLVKIYLFIGRRVSAVPGTHCFVRSLLNNGWKKGRVWIWWCNLWCDWVLASDGWGVRNISDARSILQKFHHWFSEISSIFQQVCQALTIKFPRLFVPRRKEITCENAETFLCPSMGSKSNQKC